jgi:hypothetical protein
MPLTRGRDDLEVLVENITDLTWVKDRSSKRKSVREMLGDVALDDREFEEASRRRQELIKKCIGPAKAKQKKVEIKTEIKKEEPFREEVKQAIKIESPSIKLDLDEDEPAWIRERSKGWRIDEDSGIGLGI